VNQLICNSSIFIYRGSVAVEDEFWEFMEKLVSSTSIIIDRPKGSTHPHFPELTYPLDYGYLKDTKSTDGGGIDVWLGSLGSKKIDCFLATVDLHKMDSEIKLIVGCSQSEILTIQNFHKSHKMHSILIQRKK
jgi:inorganic pyrophosphatase